MLPANRPCGFNFSIAGRLLFFRQLPNEKVAAFFSISHLRHSAHGRCERSRSEYPDQSPALSPPPTRGKLGQESPSRGTLFPQNFISAVAVIPNRRRADEYPRLPCRPCQPFRQISGTEDPAVVDATLLFARPNSKHAFARKMNHCVKSRNFFRRNRLRGIPDNVAFALCIPADQAVYLPSLRRK